MDLSNENNRYGYGKPHFVGHFLSTEILYIMRCEYGVGSKILTAILESAATVLLLTLRVNS